MLDREMIGHFMDKQALAREHLAENDRHIEEAGVRITEQKALIGNLVAEGRDTMEAEKLLERLVATRDNMQRYREMILEELKSM